MKAKEFYKELAKTERKWDISFGVSIRQIPEATSLLWFCPITAVCLRVAKKQFNVLKYEDAGKALKLSPSFVKRVVNGSDSLLYYHGTRRKLLKALGL